MVPMMLCSFIAGRPARPGLEITPMWATASTSPPATAPITPRRSPVMTSTSRSARSLASSPAGGWLSTPDTR
jgi:hypothetical protein